jgi:hypothetical protein
MDGCRAHVSYTATACAHVVAVTTNTLKTPTYFPACRPNMRSTLNNSTQDTVTDTVQSTLCYLQAQHAQDPEQLCTLHVARQQFLNLQNVNHRDIRRCVVCELNV